MLGPFAGLSRAAEPFQVILWQASKIGRVVPFQTWEMDCDEIREFCAFFCGKH